MTISSVRVALSNEAALKAQCLIVCFVLNFVCMGSSAVTTVLIAPLQEMLDASSASILFVTFGLMTLFMSVASPVAGWLLSRFSYAPVLSVSVLLIGGAWVCLGDPRSLWQVGLIYSLGFGVGLISLSLACTFWVSELFVASRGSATSAVMVGYSVGAAALPPLAVIGMLSTPELSVVRWYGALMLLGAPIVYLMSRGSSARSARQDATLEKDDVSQGRDRVRVRSYLVAFAFSALLMAGCGIAGGVPASILPIYAAEMQVAPVAAASLVSVYFVASVVGTLIYGWVSDRYSEVVSAVMVLALLAGASLLFLSAESVPFLVLGAMILGLGVGASMILPVTLATTLFPPGVFVRALSWIAPCSLIAISIALPVAGWFDDAFLSYRPTFLMTLIAALIGFAAVIGIATRSVDAFGGVSS